MLIHIRIYKNWELALASFVLLIGFHATSDKNKPCLRCAGKICWRCYLESNRHLASITFPSRLRLRSVDLERLKGEFGICIWLIFFWGHPNMISKPLTYALQSEKCGQWMQPPNHTSTSKHNLHDRLWRYRSDHVTPQSAPVDGFTHSFIHGVMWGK